MTVTLLNNLTALPQPVSVSLSAPLGALADGAGGTLTIGAEALTVIEGAGTVVIRADRGATPIVHAVGATATYSAPSGGSQTLAQVLAAGNTISPGSNSVPSIAGATPNAGIWLSPVVATDGQQIQLVGGDGSHSGGVAVLGAGTETTDGASGAYVTANGGSVVAGGQVQIGGGDAGTGSGGSGGDITVQPGAGDGAGRHGLIFLNLPTSDPGVSGALFVLAGVVKVSP